MFYRDGAGIGSRFCIANFGSALPARRPRFNDAKGRYNVASGCACERQKILLRGYYAKFFSICGGAAGLVDARGFHIIRSVVFPTSHIHNGERHCRAIGFGAGWISLRHIFFGRAH